MVGASGDHAISGRAKVARCFRRSTCDYSWRLCGQIGQAGVNDGGAGARWCGGCFSIGVEDVGWIDSSQDGLDRVGRAPG